MGKKQTKTKGKFDNVEISSPILDAEIIKAIHTPPKKEQKEGGFKALFADSGSQDPLNDIPAVNQHLPSYVGISCAISGYTNYSPYLKSARSGHNSPSNSNQNAPTGSSPLTATKTNHLTQAEDLNRSHQYQHDRLTPTHPELKRVPSPSVVRKEDDRHHGTCVGARYCLLPAPDKTVNKHIPLLGIDDDKEINDDDELESDKSVQKRIASLYGDQFAEGWKESNANKARKDLEQDQKETNESKKPKDLVKLKPTPSVEATKRDSHHQDQDGAVNLPDSQTLSKAPVFAGVEKQFLGQLLSNGVSIKPTTQVARATTTTTTTVTQKSGGGSADGQAIIQTTRHQVTEDFNDEPDSHVTITETHTNNHPVETGADLQIKQQHEEYEEQQQQQHQQELEPAREEEIVGGLSELSEHTHSEQLFDTWKDDLIQVADSPQVENEIHNNTSNTYSSDLISGQDGPNEPKKDLIDVNDTIITTQEYVEPLIEELEPLDMGNEGSQEIHEFISHEPEETQGHSSTSDRDGKYFLEQLKVKSDAINANVAQAEAILNDEEECQPLDEEAIGKIHSAIGKANLLLNKKCKQFEELCVDNLGTNDRDKKFATLNDDLEGFWDMIVIQLNECEEAFNQIWAARDNGWKFDEDQIHESGSSSSSSGRQHSKPSKPKLNAQKDQERRNRLQEHINQMKQKEAANPQKYEDLVEEDPSTIIIEDPQ